MKTTSGYTTQGRTEKLIQMETKKKQRIMVCGGKESMVEVPYVGLARRTVHIKQSSRDLVHQKGGKCCLGAFDGDISF